MMAWGQKAATETTRPLQLKTFRHSCHCTKQYGGPQDYSASDPEGTLKHRIKIAYTR
jgi:hypothetical protein